MHSSSSLQRTLLCFGGSVSEIYLLKVGNYEKCVVEKTTFKHLLPFKLQHSIFFRVKEYPVSVMIINLGPPPWSVSLESLKDLLKSS